MHRTRNPELTGSPIGVVKGAPHVHVGDSSQRICQIIAQFVHPTCVWGIRMGDLIISGSRVHPTRAWGIH